MNDLEGSSTVSRSGVLSILQHHSSVSVLETSRNAERLHVVESRDQPRDGTADGRSRCCAASGPVPCVYFTSDSKALTDAGANLQGLGPNVRSIGVKTACRSNPIDVRWSSGATSHARPPAILIPSTWNETCTGRSKLLFSTFKKIRFASCGLCPPCALRAVKPVPLM